MTNTITIAPAGYIVADNEVIYAVGATADEAWAGLVQTMQEAYIHLIDDREYRTAEQEAADDEVMVSNGSWTRASLFRIKSASADLIAQVESEGGAIAWFSVGGVCCTRDEAEAE